MGYILNYKGEKIDELLKKIDTAFGDIAATLIDNQTITLTNGEGLLEGFSVEENGIYTVIYNGTEYTDLQTVAVETESGMAYDIGNALAFGDEDNGIPFAIATLSSEGVTFIADMTGDTSSASCTLTVIGTIIKTLDTKYLPEHLQFGGDATTTDAITWDGNTEGLVSVLDMAYYVSNAVPSFTDLQNGGTIVVSGTSTSFTSENVVDASAVGIGENIIIVQSDSGMVVIALNGDAYMTENGQNIPFPKAGIYFTKMDSNGDGTVEYISEFTINDYTFIEGSIKYLNNKYLEPFETVEVGTDTLTWDGNTEGLYKPADSENTEMYAYLVSDAVPTYEELKNGGVVEVITNGEKTVKDFTESDLYINEDNGIIVVATLVQIATKENAYYSTIIYEKPGVYFPNRDGVYISSFTINGYAGFIEEQTKLKAECLPASAVFTLNTAFPAISATAAISCNKSISELIAMDKSELINSVLDYSEDGGVYEGLLKAGSVYKNTDSDGTVNLRIQFSLNVLGIQEYVVLIARNTSGEESMALTRTS